MLGAVTCGVMTASIGCRTNATGEARWYKGNLMLVLGSNGSTADCTVSVSSSILRATCHVLHLFCTCEVMTCRLQWRLFYSVSLKGYQKNQIGKPLQQLQVLLTSILKCSCKSGQFKAGQFKRSCLKCRGQVSDKDKGYLYRKGVSVGGYRINSLRPMIWPR